MCVRPVVPVPPLQHIDIFQVRQAARFPVGAELRKHLAEPSPRDLCALWQIRVTVCRGDHQVLRLEIGSHQHFQFALGVIAVGARDLLRRHLADTLALLFAGVRPRHCVGDVPHQPTRARCFASFHLPSVFKSDTKTGSGRPQPPAPRFYDFSEYPQISGLSIF